MALRDLRVRGRVGAGAWTWAAGWEIGAKGARPACEHQDTRGSG